MSTERKMPGLDPAAQTGLAKWLLEVLAIATVYFVTARLSLLLAFQNTNASPVWPASGIAFAALLLMGRHVWPGILIGAFLANATVFLENPAIHPGLVIIPSCFIALGNTLEALTGIFLLRSLGVSRNPLEDTRDVCKFALASLLMCLASASIGPTSLFLAGIVPSNIFATTWFTWWLGDATGILILTPILITFSKQKLDFWKPARLMNAVLLSLLVIALGFLIFSRQSLLGAGHYTLEYLFLPILMWAAFQLGPMGVSLSTLLVSAGAIMGTLQGSGPFIRPTLNESLLLLQAFIGTYSVTGLILNAVLGERGRAEDTLQKTQIGENEPGPFPRSQ